MIIPFYEVLVGEVIPVRLSFLNRLRDFQTVPAQTLVGGSIMWVSQSLTLATYVGASAALVTSPQGAADNILNDAVLGRFTILASGLCTIYCTVQAINPTATYVGITQLQIEAIPVP